MRNLLDFIKGIFLHVIPACIIVLLFYGCSYVSIIHVEQINAGWVEVKEIQIFLITHVTKNGVVPEDQYQKQSHVIFLFL